MNACLDAPHVRQNGAGGEMGLQSQQIFRIAGNRRAQKDIVAVPERIVNGRADLVDHLFSDCEIKRLCMDIVGDQAGIGKLVPDRFGDGAADQPEPDKTAGECVHKSSTFRVFDVRSKDTTKREGRQEVDGRGKDADE